MKFTNNGDGTVLDNVTGLMWQQQESGELTWPSAFAYCKSLTTAGYANWRLPDIKELFSIVSDQAAGVVFVSSFIQTSPIAEYYWANNTGVRNADLYRWAVNAGGGAGDHSMTETISAGGERPVHVRCVRGTSTLGKGPRLHDNADGTVTMTFRVDGLDEIVRWIVGWAGRVKVVAPLPLREKVLDQHRRAIAFQG